MNELSQIGSSAVAPMASTHNSLQARDMYFRRGYGVRFDPNEVVQGYLTYKKTHTPRTLLYAYA